jgi:hypothetical protein
MISIASLPKNYDFIQSPKRSTEEMAILLAVRTTKREKTFLVSKDVLVKIEAFTARKKRPLEIGVRHTILRLLGQRRPAAPYTAAAAAGELGERIRHIVFECLGVWKES